MPQTRCSLSSELCSNSLASSGCKSADLLKQVCPLQDQPDMVGRGWIDLPEGLKNLFSLD